MRNAKFERYEAYKDSGIEWLGELPVHWKTMMIKNIYRNFGSGTTPDSSEPRYYENGTVSWLNTTDLKNYLVYETKKKITEHALLEKKLKIYPVNTLAIAMYGQGDTRGSVGLLKIKATTNQAACMMYNTSNAIQKYMLWWFVAKKTDIRKINVGATQPNMNQDFLRNLFISLPPLFEQQAIATYIDTKTAQIDRKIDLLSQKAAQYGKLKQSLINETVTRGLDKTVAMKDSGVEWIGEVPAHWKVTAITNITATVSVKNHPNEELLSVYRDYGVIIKNTRDDNHNKAGADLSSYKLVEPGYLVINKMKAWQGSLGLSEFRGIVSPAYITCKTDKRIVERSYLHHLLRCRNYINEYNRLSYGVRVDQWDMRYDDFKYVPVLLPPLLEQKAIANYLDEKTAHIDCIVATINTQIDKLKELRKTLINDIVTGKICVLKPEHRHEQHTPN